MNIDISMNIHVKSVDIDDGYRCVISYPRQLQIGDCDFHQVIKKTRMAPDICI